MQNILKINVVKSKDGETKFRLSQKNLSCHKPAKLPVAGRVSVKNCL